MPFEGPRAPQQPPAAESGVTQEVAYDAAAEKAAGAQLLEQLKAIEGIPSDRFSGAYRGEADLHPEFRSMFESHRVALGYNNIWECANMGVGDMTHSNPGGFEGSTKMISDKPWRPENPDPAHRAMVAEITRDAVETLGRVNLVAISEADPEIAGFLRRRFDGFMETLDQRDIKDADKATVRMIHRAVTGILDTGVNPNNGERADEFVRKYPAGMVMERISTVESLAPILQQAILPDAMGRRRMVGR